MLVFDCDLPHEVNYEKFPLVVPCCKSRGFSFESILDLGFSMSGGWLVLAQLILLCDEISFSFLKNSHEWVF